MAENDGVRHVRGRIDALEIDRDERTGAAVIAYATLTVHHAHGPGTPLKLVAQGPGPSLTLAHLAEGVNVALFGQLHPPTRSFHVR